MPREEHRTLNGLRHHLLVWDDGPASPTIVLLHGWLDLGWSFAPFVDALRPILPSRVIAPDLRGHGDSDRIGPGGFYHFADYIADMHDLLVELPRPLYLVGHSMGGVVASQLCGAFPELVDRLVIIEGLGPPKARPETPPERMARWIGEVRRRERAPPRPMATLDAAAERLRRSNPRLTDELARFLAGKGTRLEDEGLAWKYDPLHRTASPSPATADAHRAFLRNIACPVLVVHGGESPFRGYIEDDRISDLGVREEVTIDGAGHMVQHDQPERLAKVVGGFLGRG